MPCPTKCTSEPGVYWSNRPTCEVCRVSMFQTVNMALVIRYLLPGYLEPQFETARLSCLVVAVHSRARTQA